MSNENVLQIWMWNEVFHVLIYSNSSLYCDVSLTLFVILRVLLSKSGCAHGLSKCDSMHAKMKVASKTRRKHGFRREFDAPCTRIWLQDPCFKAWTTPKRRIYTFGCTFDGVFQQQHRPSPVNSCLPSSSPMCSSFQVQQSSINLIHPPTPSSGQSQPRLLNRKPADCLEVASLLSLRPPPASRCLASFTGAPLKTTR